MQYANHNVI